VKFTTKFKWKAKFIRRSNKDNLNSSSSIKSKLKSFSRQFLTTLKKSSRSDKNSQI